MNKIHKFIDRIHDHHDHSHLHRYKKEKDKRAFNPQEIHASPVRKKRFSGKGKKNKGGWRGRGDRESIPPLVEVDFIQNQLYPTTTPTVEQQYTPPIPPFPSESSFSPPPSSSSSNNLYHQLLSTPPPLSPALIPTSSLSSADFYHQPFPTLHSLSSYQETSPTTSFPVTSFSQLHTQFSPQHVSPPPDWYAQSSTHPSPPQTYPITTTVAQQPHNTYINPFVRISNTIPTTTMNTTANRTTTVAPTTPEPRREWKPEGFIQDFITFQRNLEVGATSEYEDVMFPILCRVFANESPTSPIDFPQQQQQYPDMKVHDLDLTVDINDEYEHNTGDSYNDDGYGYNTTYNGDNAGYQYSNGNSYQNVDGVIAPEAFATPNGVTDKHDEPAAYPSSPYAFRLPPPPPTTPVLNFRPVRSMRKEPTEEEQPTSMDVDAQGNFATTSEYLKEGDQISITDDVGYGASYSLSEGNGVTTEGNLPDAQSLEVGSPEESNIEQYNLEEAKGDPQENVQSWGVAEENKAYPFQEVPDENKTEAPTEEPTEGRSQFLMEILNGSSRLRKVDTKDATRLQKRTLHENSSPDKTDLSSTLVGALASRRTALEGDDEDGELESWDEDS